MAFLRINGLDVDALVDDFEMEDVSNEAYDRAINESLEGITYSVKKQITFTTPPMTASAALALEGWVRGLGHFWNFSRVDSASTRWSLYSNDGGNLFSAGTSSSSVFQSQPNALRLNSSGTSNATAQFGSEGDWTISYWQASAETPAYQPIQVTSLGGTLSKFCGGVSATTIRSLAASATTDYLTVTLRGRLAVAGSTTAATCHFSDVRVLPYSATTAMLASMQTTNWMPAGGMALLPFVTVSGDVLAKADVNAIGTGEAGPITMKGFVETIEMTPAVVSGSFSTSHRRLRVKLIEK